MKTVPQNEKNSVTSSEKTRLNLESLKEAQIYGLPIIPFPYSEQKSRQKAEGDSGSLIFNTNTPLNNHYHYLNYTIQLLNLLQRLKIHFHLLELQFLVFLHLDQLSLWVIHTFQVAELLAMGFQLAILCVNFCAVLTRKLVCFSHTVQNRIKSLVDNFSNFAHFDELVDLELGSLVVKIFTKLDVFLWEAFLTQFRYHSLKLVLVHVFHF